MARGKHYKKRQSFFKSSFFKSAFKIVLSVVLIASIVVNLFTFVFPIVKYYGKSMSPTYSDGQIMMVSTLSEIERGDVIAFYYNNKILLRRVIALGNDQLSIDAFGKVSVNGKELKEGYAEKLTLGQCNINFPYSVPTGSYFVLGDNREIALDSRLEEIGAVTEDRLIGEVLFTIYPFDF